MKSRSPVVAILGHVDHGKTSLLDYIRKSRLANKEFGGITQRIGAYEIDTLIKGYSTSKITFIDTPGHEAFSQLRARGAQVADIALLIIDAKDSLMPQTIESISHIKQAKIPFIVVLNKIDLPDANPNKVMNDLLKHDVQTEEKGGTTPLLKVSALKGTGVHELLESILLISAEANLTYEESAPLEAYVIETKKDKRGIVASIIIKNSILKITDVVYAEGKKAKIRGMINDLGKFIQDVSPSTPFELLGFEELPDVGSQLTREAVEKVVLPLQPITKVDLRALLKASTEIPDKKLSLIVKTDSQGSHEAIVTTLKKIQGIDIVLSAVGDVHRSDIFLAKTANAIVIGFSVSIDNEVRELAKQEKVIIKTYNIIYELLEELTEVSALMHEKEEKEKNLVGEAKIQATFTIEGEKIFGVKITKGKIHVDTEVEIHRNNNLIGKVQLSSLKQRAKIVQEVKKDQEAGMVFSGALDIRVGDVVKCIL
ncbi:MAG: translation initiation factor IF-2 [Candidatus Roizmanbacteria bacterium]